MYPRTNIALVTEQRSSQEYTTDSRPATGQWTLVLWSCGVFNLAARWFLDLCKCPTNTGVCMCTCALCFAGRGVMVECARRSIQGRGVLTGLVACCSWLLLRLRGPRSITWCAWCMYLLRLAPRHTCVCLFFYFAQFYYSAVITLVLALLSLQFLHHQCYYVLYPRCNIALVTEQRSSQEYTADSTPATGHWSCGGFKLAVSRQVVPKPL